MYFLSNTTLDLMDSFLSLMEVGLCTRSDGAIALSRVRALLGAINMEGRGGGVGGEADLLRSFSIK